MGTCFESKQKTKKNPEISAKSNTQTNSINIINPNINSTIIWIDRHLDSKENVLYIDELTKLDKIEPKTFKNIEDAINHIKTLKFEEIKIIVSGSMYSEFIKNFKNNIRNMYIAPKIIIFRYKNNIDYNNIEKFYKYGGVTTDF